MVSVFLLFMLVMSFIINFIEKNIINYGNRDQVASEEESVETEVAGKPE